MAAQLISSVLLEYLTGNDLRFRQYSKFIPIYFHIYNLHMKGTESVFSHESLCKGDNARFTTVP